MHYAPRSGVLGHADMPAYLRVLRPWLAAHAACHPPWPLSGQAPNRVELTDYRERFPILAETTYLINHSLGAMPAEAARRLQRYADEWATRGARAWGEGWWDTPITVGDQIGRIVGAPPGSTVMHQNVTVAEAVVLSCFDFGPPRNRIVFEAGLFPSMRYVQQAT